MLRYADRTVTPPGGAYVFTQLESGFRFRQVAFLDLVKEIKDHRKANNFPLGPNFEADVEDASCREMLQMFPNYEGCLDETGGRAAYKGRSWSLSDVRHFLNVMAAWISKGAQFVPQEEAERRAHICIGCPENVQLAACLGCSGVSSAVSAIKGSRHTSVDDRLRTCNACGCQLAVKCWMPKEALKRDGVEYPPHCWVPE